MLDSGLAIPPNGVAKSGEDGGNRYLATERLRLRDLSRRISSKALIGYC
jgi:hypothetical protein